MTDPIKLTDTDLESIQAAEGHNWINLLSVSQGLSRPMPAGASVLPADDYTQVARARN